jgi:hypothetical protein
MVAVTIGLAQVVAQEFVAEQPILLTAAGQSADVLMVKLMLERNKLQFTFDKLATPEQLTGMKTLVLVAGGSSKGLGAAKIDAKQELERTSALIARAKKEGIKVIGVHIGGEARRGSMSDQFNKATAEAADCLVVLKSGDQDQFFTKIATARRIPLFGVEKITDAIPVFGRLFARQTPQPQEREQ